ncbi:MAG: aminoacyl-tRNA hydrolase [Anaerolineae bacterium]|nr:aminoacyl-tRNA hydrolase [Anaerolineae bacterium]
MERYLLVGLGNPGAQYAKTRHNIGFMCLDALAAAHQITFDGKKFKARWGDGLLEGRRVLLLKPQTFMNLSGEAVRPAADFYQIPPERMLIIYDDLDTPLGTLRLRQKGGAGGQKGMASIIQHLGTQAFPRIRFGIDRPPGKMDPAAYVLQPFRAEEQMLVQETIARTLKAVSTWLSEGIDTAMNRFNGTAEQAAAAQSTPPQPDSPPPTPTK